MNTEIISKKIVYQELEELKQLNTVRFYIYASKNNLFSNFDFISCFQDMGLFFWTNVIFNTEISFDELFERFEKYLINDDFFNTIKDLYEFNVNKNLKLSNVKKTLRICERYFNEYEKYNK